MAVEVCFLLLAFVNLVNGQLACQWTADQNGTQYSYDLSQMTKSTGYYGGIDTPYTYDYEMNVCDVVHTVSDCSSKGALICQFNKGTLNYVATVASWTKTPYGTWSLIDTNNPRLGVRQTFANGDICYIFGQQRVRTAVINFLCGNPTSPNNFTVYEEPNTCVFTMNITSSYACVQEGGGGSGGDLSGGTVFIIILICVAAVYLIGGIIYNKTKGASGFEMLPNSGFWRDFPGYVKDGFRFLIGGCKKSGDSSYDEL